MPSSQSYSPRASPAGLSPSLKVLGASLPTKGPAHPMLTRLLQATPEDRPALPQWLPPPATLHTFLGHSGQGIHLAWDVVVQLVAPLEATLLVG